MFTKIKKLFSHSVIYGFGNATGKIIGFLLIPVYTRYLMPEDYGILSLCTMFGAVLFVFLNMGLSSAIFKNYFHADTQKEKNTVLTTTAFLLIFVSIPTIIFLMFKASWLAELFLGGKAYQNAIRLVVINTFLSLMITIPFAIMRAREESKKYASITVLKTSLTIGLTVFLVVVLKKGFWGILIGQGVVLFLLCISLIYWTFKKVPLAFSLKEAKSLLSFGLPLVGSGLAGFILTLSDRCFLKYYSTLHQVGLYSLGYKFGTVLWFLVWAFQLAWPQFVFSNEKLPEAKSLYSRVSTYYIGAIGFACLSISMLSEEVVKIMATPSFFEAYKVIPLIALSQLFYGLFYLGTVGIYLQRKTKYFPLTVGFAACINLVLNYFWIPRHGMMGAALATMIAYVLQFVLSFAISMRYYPISYEYVRILKLIMISLGLYFVGLSVQFNTIILSLAFKVALLLLYPFLLLVVGFFVDTELAYVKTFLLRKAVCNE